MKIFKTKAMWILIYVLLTGCSGGENDLPEVEISQSELTGSNQEPINIIDETQKTILNEISEPIEFVSIENIEASTEPVNNIQSIQLIDIEEPLVPINLVEGDRDFNGNGPEVEISLEIDRCNKNQFICAEIKFKARELLPDWSTTEEKWSRIVYRAPKGYAIEKIHSNTFSEARFISQPGPFQFIWPAPDAYSG